MTREEIGGARARGLGARHGRNDERVLEREEDAENVRGIERREGSNPDQNRKSL